MPSKTSPVDVTAFRFSLSEGERYKIVKGYDVAFVTERIDRLIDRGWHMVYKKRALV